MSSSVPTGRSSPQASLLHDLFLRREEQYLTPSVPKLLKQGAKTCKWPENEGHDDFLISLALCARALEAIVQPAAGQKIASRPMYQGESQYRDY